MAFRRQRPQEGPPLPVTSVNWDDNLAQGLVGAFPLSEGAGTIVNNAIGRGRGVLSSATLWTPRTSRRGPAIIPVASTGYLDTGIANLNTSGTICWWMLQTAAFNSSTQRSLWGQGLNGGNLFSAQIFTDNNWYVGWYNIPTPNWLSVAATAANAPQNTWAFYTLTWTPTGHAFYLNAGVLQGTNVVTTGAAALGTNLLYGVQGFTNTGNTPGNASFAGQLGELRVYNRVLTQGEIAQAYAEQWRPYFQPRLRGLGVSAPTGFPVAISETGAAADAFSVTVTGQTAAITETGAATDAATLTSTRGIGIAEAGAAAEAVAAGAGAFSAAIAEAGAAADTATTQTVIPVVFLEIGTLIDAVVLGLLPASVAIRESGAALDHVELTALEIVGQPLQYAMLV